jgi:hypothetical protein
MKSVRLDYPLGLLCRVFGVSRSGFYAALERQPSQRAQDDERLKIAIKAAHIQTRETYGPLRLQSELVSQGFNAGRDRIVRCGASWVCVASKTQVQSHDEFESQLPVAPNLLEQTLRQQGQTRPGSVTSPMSQPMKDGFTWPASRTSSRVRWWATRWAPG